MIPKIIHYCWFGPKEKPASFYRWLQTWKRYLPEHELLEWNESNFDVERLLYCREAYRTGNWAFVADVCRVYALNTCGGLYLDTDVEICRNPGDLLTVSNGLLGVEEPGVVGTGLMASEKDSVWTKLFIDYYAKNHFINCVGHPHRLPNPVILMRSILPLLKNSDLPKILPEGYVCGIDKLTKKAAVTENTIAVHHYDASWRHKKSLKTKIRNIVQGLKVRYLY